MVCTPHHNSHQGTMQGVDPNACWRCLRELLAEVEAKVARLEAANAALAASLIRAGNWIGAGGEWQDAREAGTSVQVEREVRDDIQTALSDYAGEKECEKCGGDGARHVAGEPVWQEPCGECSGEGVVSVLDAGKGWLSPEVREQAANRLRYTRIRVVKGVADDNDILEGIDAALAALDALKGEE